MAQVSFDPTMGQAMPFQRTTDPQATADERTYATFTHLTLLAYHVVPAVVLGALVMWLIKKDQSPFLNDHGKEAVNFQISLCVYALIALVLTPLCGIGIPVWVGVYTLGLVGMIMGAHAANRGEFYRYPACLRFIK